MTATWASQMLTTAQKGEARMFKLACQEALDNYVEDLQERSSPVQLIPVHLSVVRHECTFGRLATVSLKERYETSSCGTFGFIFKEGSCPRCGLVQISPVGKLVIVEDRPPLEGRVAR